MILYFSNTACAQWVNSACPARRQRAFAAAASRIHINPKDCAAKKRNIQCDRTSLYRTIDGSCNNLQNPEWGQANSQQRRYLKYNAYDDGNYIFMSTQFCLNFNGDKNQNVDIFS